MNEQPEYGTVDWEETNSDGTTTVNETGFYNGIINKRKVSIRKDIVTNESDWLKDLLANLSPMKGDTPRFLHRGSIAFIQLLVVL